MAKMTRVEAGKLGAKKSIQRTKELKEERIKKYYENPTVCKNCGKILDYEHRKSSFCSRSCSTSYNNKLRVKPTDSVCLFCGKPTKGKDFCSQDCYVKYNQDEWIKSWKDGKETGLRGKYAISYRIKQYLFNKYNCSCQRCGWGEKNIYTNTIPLEVHHIDGNYMNNNEDNLELLCPNCHSLTETAKSHNKKGRKERSKYDYYKD